jgi:3-oxoadipate enol-lactonase
MRSDIPACGEGCKFRCPRYNVLNAAPTLHREKTPMPTFKPTPDLDMHYQVDDFTDPWRHPKTILMLHGNAESGLAWYAWVPKLARDFRVVRPDMRGFGQSTAMPAEYPWTLDRLTEDFCLLMDHLGIARFHLVGAKIGGTVARAFAARRPERVTTLSLVGTPAPLRVGAAERVPELIRDFQTHGVESWARQSMAGRLGTGFPPEGVEWWTRYMGRTAVSTQLGFMGTIACADIRADLPNIACPTLVITTAQSGLGSVDETRAWQQQISNSELLVLQGNSYHVAATHADRAAEAVRDFIARRGGER